MTEALLKKKEITISILCSCVRRIINEFLSFMICSFLADPPTSVHSNSSKPTTKPSKTTHQIMCLHSHHVHVVCGCTHDVIISKCSSPSRIPGAGTWCCTFKKEPSPTKIPYQGLPCCGSCYPGKFAELRNNYLKQKEECSQRYGMATCTKEEYTFHLEKIEREYERQLDLLSRPYKGTLKDALEYGRFGLAVEGGS